MVGDSDEEAVQLEPLTDQECRQLLASQSIGRFAFCHPGSPPEVVPVNFVLDGDVIVFRTGPGPKLQATLESQVSFQVDVVDPVHHTGWSVLVHGTATASDHWDRATRRPESWAPGDKTFWVHLSIDTISGRRLRMLQLPPDLRLRHGYR